MDPVNLAEFEEAARARLTSEAYDYYAGGANDENTLRRNREAWSEIALHYPVLRDVSARDTSTTVLGGKSLSRSWLLRLPFTGWPARKASARRRVRRDAPERSW